ncbi:unnamed protein product [Adineta ricciae]|uniref:NHL repeat containing protein-like protein n=1 Tax=Adineta ricciae TaxID=249248 RepID=A0A815ETL5_ADIRI|nr:unnamed protein product [Adineta ricciae]CAF1314634.1 unnamed protein product [Adineta ricciae]
MVIVRATRSKVHRCHHPRSVTHDASQSTHVIHVCVRSRPKIPLPNKVTMTSEKTPQVIINPVHSTQSTSLRSDLQKYRISPEFEDQSVITVNSSKLTEAKMFYSNSNGLGITREYHRDSNKKKKEKQKKIFISISIAIGIVLLVSSILIPVLLLLPRTKTTYPEAKLRWNSTGITVAGITGLSGVANNCLNTPMSVAIDRLNTLYIADYTCYRIQRWLRDATSGTTVAGNLNCTAGSILTGLTLPTHILLDSDDNMYITDYSSSKILFWPNNATIGRIIAGTGVIGNAGNELFTPFGLTRDSDTGTLYIADTGNHRIMRYLYNATSGTVVAGGNGPGLNSSQLHSPSSVYYESFSDSLIIVNFNLNNVVRWKIGDSRWKLITGTVNGTMGSTSALLSSPVGMTVDPMGNIYVADLNNHRIQFFLSDEANGTTIAGVSTVSGSDTTHLTTPYGVALDNQLNLYVVDTGNHRIQKFLRY